MGFTQEFRSVNEWSILCDGDEALACGGQYSFYEAHAPGESTSVAYTPEQIRRTARMPATVSAKQPKRMATSTRTFNPEWT